MLYIRFESHFELGVAVVQKDNHINERRYGNSKKKYMIIYFVKYKLSAIRSTIYNLNIFN